VSNFNEIPLPGFIPMDLPFKKAINEIGVEKNISVNVGGLTILSQHEDLGDIEMLSAMLESKIKKIIEDEAGVKFTLVSLENSFSGDGAIPIEGYPGLFLKKSLVFQEI
jgi:hypothetical protein